MSTISIDGWYDLSKNRKECENGCGNNCGNKDNKDKSREDKETSTENGSDKNDENNEKDERIRNLEKKMIELDQRQKHLETLIHTLTNENLKMINRVLEAEIALERSKNSLIRNHIPFHFSPSPLSKSFGNI